MVLMTTSDLPLKRIARGKVRDVYEVEATGCCWSPPTASAPTTW